MTGSRGKLSFAPIREIKIYKTSPISHTAINLKFFYEERYIDRISYRYDILLLAACYSKLRDNSCRTTFVFLAEWYIVVVPLRFPKIEYFPNQSSTGERMAKQKTRQVSRLSRLTVRSKSVNDVMRRRILPISRLDNSSRKHFVKIITTTVGSAAENPGRTDHRRHQTTIARKDQFCKRI